jgi:hypothetical protein
VLRTALRGLRCMPLLGGLAPPPPFIGSAIPCRLAPCPRHSASVALGLSPGLAAVLRLASPRRRLLASPCTVVYPPSRACSPPPRWANSAPSPPACSRYFAVVLLVEAIASRNASWLWRWCHRDSHPPLETPFYCLTFAGCFYCQDA